MFNELSLALPSKILKGKSCRAFWWLICRLVLCKAKFFFPCWIILNWDPLITYKIVHQLKVRPNLSKRRRHNNNPGPLFSVLLNVLIYIFKFYFWVLYSKLVEVIYSQLYYKYLDSVHNKHNRKIRKPFYLFCLC